MVIKKQLVNNKMVQIGILTTILGVSAYITHKMKGEKLIQEKINEHILENQENIIDELAYHEEVIEKLEESISKKGKGESRFNGICTSTKGFKKS